MKTLGILLLLIALGNELVYLSYGQITLFSFLFVLIAIIKGYLVGMLFDRSINSVPKLPTNYQVYHDHRDFSIHNEYHIYRGPGREIFEVKSQTPDGKALSYRYGREDF